MRQPLAKTISPRHLWLILIPLALLTVVWLSRPGGIVGVAAAKGQLLSRAALPAMTVDELRARDAVQADGRFQQLAAGHTLTFLYAQPMTLAEGRPWAADGCAHLNCSMVTFYDVTAGGTVTAVYGRESGAVIDVERHPQARPGASLRLVPDLLTLAAADERVQALLGDVDEATAVMVPMSTWLADDACRDDWCVDLTFPEPAGSGKIVHVVVNMHRQQVARVFVTRGRVERSSVPGEAQLQRSLSAKPAVQIDEEGEEIAPYEDGCHAADGWDVCWEMTGHDGLLFRDGSYDGGLVFSTVKISQVEVFYAAWPGGYRDELGFDSSVPPALGTHVTDLPDGFEVRQLFTEPFDWPNCVCCYRYEQIMRFFADGAFEQRFISHGPGCDDLSSYRPFWRIDLDLEGGTGDEVWAFDETQWVESEREFEMDLWASLSPDGQRLATFDDDLHYRWRPVRTDPLGRDEGRLFLLRWNEEEGAGPIAPGPADTYEPPRQWLSDERVSGNNVVLWYIPILNTKKGDPWWCLPDPEPDFSPCEAILRAEPGDELTQPTEEELSAVRATATPAATGETIILPTPTPRPIQGKTAEEILLNAGCGSCHLIGEFGEAGKVGPDMSAIGHVAQFRSARLSAEAYIRQSIVAPNALIAPDCPNGPCRVNVMPQNYAERLTEAQIDTLVSYLSSLDALAPPQVIGGTPAPRPTVVTVRQPPSGSTGAGIIGVLLIVLLVAGMGVFATRRRRDTLESP